MNMCNRLYDLIDILVRMELKDGVHFCLDIWGTDMWRSGPECGKQLGGGAGKLQGCMLRVTTVGYINEADNNLG
jgi:hypothetical protein